MNRLLLTGLLVLGLAACSSPNNTNPPADNSLSGTVSAPQGGDVQNTTVQACFIDGDRCDANSPNTKQLDITQAGSSAPYSFSGLAVGQYGVFAAKDVNGNSTVDNGDYFGCFGDAQGCQAVTPPANGIGVSMSVVGDNGGGGDGACANELTEDITVSGVFVNTPSDCDYLLKRPVSLSNGQFTIEPGVVIKFEQDTYLRVSDNASLDAVGTAAAPIRFEALSPVKGFAKGLNIGSGSLVTRLEHAVFSNLGKEDRGVFGGLQNGAIDGLNGGGLIMKNVTVRGSIYDGVTLHRLPILEFENNTFTDNARYPVRIAAGQLHQLDAGSDYLGGDTPNGRPYINVDGVGRKAAFESATWKKLNVPYFVGIAVNVENGTVTLEPGVTFVFGSGASFGVDGPGALTAIGTADTPIVFTGERQAPGSWEGIVFFRSNSDDNIFDHVEVSYGGDGFIYENSIDLPYQSFLTIRNSVISNSATYGICVGLESDIDIDNTTVLRDNALGDVGYGDECD